MKTVLIHRHPNCDRCARIARVHHAFDWIGRVSDTTETPRSGPLRLGEIAVEDLRTGVLHHGVDAFREICRAVPLYTPLLPLLRVPAFRRLVERETGGCEDGSCGLPSTAP
jgi:hypothetical protein